MISKDYTDYNFKRSIRLIETNTGNAKHVQIQ